MIQIRPANSLAGTRDRRNLSRNPLSSGRVNNNADALSRVPEVGIAEVGVNLEEEEGRMSVPVAAIGVKSKSSPRSTNRELGVSLT